MTSFYDALTKIGSWSRPMRCTKSPKRIVSITPTPNWRAGASTQLNRMLKRTAEIITLSMARHMGRPASRSLN